MVSQSVRFVTVLFEVHPVIKDLLTSTVTVFLVTISAVIKTVSEECVVSDAFAADLAAGPFHFHTRLYSIAFHRHG